MHRTVTSTPDVSVLVPVLNEGSRIREVVHAMLRQQFDGTVEFLFADGRSSDDTRAQLEDLVREDARIRLLDNPRHVVASGLNVCLRAARGRYVARMDGHALYPPTYLRDGVERLIRADAGSERSDVAWVAGPQVPMPRGRVATAIAAALQTRLGQGGSRRWSGAGGAVDEHEVADEYKAQGEYELDTGVFCGVWRREDVLAKCGWDEDWVCNEDSELAARFHDAGQRIVCLPSMAARYIPRTSLPALWRQYRLYGMYRAKTARRHPQSLRRSAVLPPLLVLDAAAAVVARGRVRRLARAGQWAYVAILLAATVQVLHAGRDAGLTGGTDLGTYGAGREAGGDLGAGGVDLGAYALVPVVMKTMHVAHGIGFLQGCARWGVPWAALRHVAGAGGEPRTYHGPIAAPSLLNERS
jgi:glycosyltransferase involved in cell wall biosynthesis